MSNELVIQGQTYETMKDQAATLVKSGMLPTAIKTADAAIAIAIKGVEVGMPMMQSFAHINIISGKPCISAEGMNFLIRKNCPAAKIDIIKRDVESCVISASRPGSVATKFEFTMEDAKRAELLANPSWKKYPKNMLFARCFSDMARTLFPDCIGGISYTPEELGAVVDIDGQVIAAEVVK
jgi:hypothetical protein